MWSDRINEFLDGDKDMEEATKDERDEIVLYRRVISIYAARLEYVPSEKGKEEFLRKIKRKKREKFVWWGVAAAAAFFAIFIPFYLVPSIKEKNIMAMEPEKRIEASLKPSELKIDPDSIRTVMDGF